MMTDAERLALIKYLVDQIDTSTYFEIATSDLAEDIRDILETNDSFKKAKEDYGDEYLQYLKYSYKDKKNEF